MTEDRGNHVNTSAHTSIIDYVTVKAANYTRKLVQCQIIPRSNNFEPFQDASIGS